MSLAVDQIKIQKCMKKAWFSLLIIIVLGSCEKDSPAPSNNISWNYLGLTGHIVNKLQISNDRIYAATDKGFYALNRNAGNQDWELLGFENKPCQSFLIINEHDIIVSLVNRQDVSQTGLYKTTDGGKNWIAYTNGFGGEGGVEPVWDITLHPEDSSTYYAVGDYVVAKSTDNGISWEPIFGEWQSFSTGMDFVSISPHHVESFWVGGQNAIEQGFVLHSNDGGANWNHWLNLVEAPSVAKGITYHPTKSSEVYMGFEGALIKTSDYGQQWETLIESEENRFFFGIGISQDNPELIYAAGWLKRFDEPQPFIIYTSQDGGKNWQEHEYAAEAFGGVYDMQLLREDGKDKLYLGLYKGGVYEVVINNY